MSLPIFSRQDKHKQTKMNSSPQFLELREIIQAKYGALHKRDIRRLTSLDLSYCQLTEFPLGLYELKELKTLDISNNDFQELPDDIDLLEKLSELIASNCKLQTLPSSIGNMKHLTYLTLTGNKLSTLPQTMNKFKKLQILDLDCNRFRVFPYSALEGISSLEKVEIRHNKLSETPYMNDVEIHLTGNPLKETKNEETDLTHNTDLEKEKYLPFPKELFIIGAAVVVILMMTFMFCGGIVVGAHYFEVVSQPFLENITFNQEVYTATLHGSVHRLQSCCQTNIKHLMDDRIQFNCDASVLAELMKETVNSVQRKAESQN